MLRVQPTFAQRWTRFFQRLRRQHNRQPTLLPVLAVVSFMTIALFLFLVISGSADQRPPLSHNIQQLLRAEKEQPGQILTEAEAVPEEQQETPRELPGELDIESIYKDKLKTRRDMKLQQLDRPQVEQHRGGEGSVPVPPHIGRQQQQQQNKHKGLKKSVDGLLHPDLLTEDGPPASPPSPSPSPPGSDRSQLHFPRRPSRPPLSSSVYTAALAHLHSSLQEKIAASKFEECILLREMIQRVDRDQKVAQRKDHLKENDHTPGNNQRMDNNEISVEEYLDQVKKLILSNTMHTQENNNDRQNTQTDSQPQTELEEKGNSWEKENESIQPAEDALSIPTPSPPDGLHDSISRLEQQVKSLADRLAAGEDETPVPKEQNEFARKKKRMKPLSKRTENEKNAQMPLPGELPLERDEHAAVAAMIRAPSRQKTDRRSTLWQVNQDKRDVVVSPEEAVAAVHQQQEKQDGGVDARHSHNSQELIIPAPSGPLSNLTVVWELASGYCSPASVEAIWVISALATKVTLGVIMDESQLCVGFPESARSLLLALRHQPMSQWEIDIFITSQSPTHYPTFPYHGEVELSNTPVPAYIISRTSTDVDRINQSWRVQILNLVDELWLSSSQQQIKAFTDAGIEPSMIQTFSSPVDTSLFNHARSFSTKFIPIDWSHLRGYNFLSVVQPWAIQQGWQVLIEAFVTEFFTADDDDVSLYIYTYREEEQEQHTVPRDVQYVQIEEWMKNYVQTLNVSTSAAALANIHIITADIPYIQLPALYAAFDAFVLPLKHDGSVLPILQAMSMSVPMIVPQNIHEHVSNDNALLIELSAKEQAIGLGYVRGQNWANPSVASLQRQLRYAVTHPEQMRALGDKARAAVLQYHTIAAVTAQMVERLAEVQDIVVAKKKLQAATGTAEAVATTQ